MKRCLLMAATLLGLSVFVGLMLGPSLFAVGPIEASPWSDMPPPPLMQGIGDASLTITTKSPRAQAYFNQGLRLLHDFWFFEAYRAFNEAARLDPSAGMTYWGMAQALSNYPTAGKQAAAAIEKAKAMMGQLSRHEQHYIRATAALMEDSGGQGHDTYVQEMQALIKEYPGDLNAPAFLAFFVMSGFDADGQPTPGNIYAQTLLRRILASILKMWPPITIGFTLSKVAPILKLD